MAATAGASRRRRHSPARQKLAIGRDLDYYLWRLLREAIGGLLRRLGLRR